MANSLPRPLAAVRNAQLPDGRVVDLSFASGVVTEITAAGGTGPGPALDLDGRLLLPAPAEPHAHLDKAGSFDAINPKLGEILGIRVQVSHKGQGGAVTLHYSSLDQLDMICQRLSGEPI